MADLKLKASKQLKWWYNMKTPIVNSPRIAEGTENLFKYFQKKDYGTSVSWEDIANATKLKDVNYRDMIYITNKVNKLLMYSEQKYLITVRGFGKRLINPNEHQNVAGQTVKKSVKIYKKAGEILNSTNMDELSEDEKVQVMNQANKYRTLQLFTSEILRKKKKEIEKQPKEDRLIFDVLQYFKDD